MTQDNERHIQEESLAGSPSSTAPIQESFAAESVGISGEEFTIPDRYGRDRITYLPVNRETGFVYWEVTPELLRQHNIGPEGLHARIVDLAEEETAVIDFSITEELGRMYVHFKADMHPVQAHLGFWDEVGKFVTLLRSNTFVTPATDVHFTDEEVWMQVDVDTRTILHASLPESGEASASSGSLVERFLSEERMMSSSSSSQLVQRKGS